jgi:hypothetical protein
MDTLRSSRPLAYILGIAMIVGGLAMATWAIAGIPTASNPDTASDVKQQSAGDAESSEMEEASTPVVAAANTGAEGEPDAKDDGGESDGGKSDDSVSDASGDEKSSTLASKAEPEMSLLIELEPSVRVSLGALVDELVIANATFITDSSTIPNSAMEKPVTVHLDIDAAGGRPVYEQLYAPVTRFDTIDPEISWTELKRAWTGRSSEVEAVVVLTDTLPALTQLLGKPGRSVAGVATTENAIEAAWNVSPTLAILPFDQLSPSLTVLPLDGQNPIENANNFDADEYPLVTTIYAHEDAATPQESALAGQFLAQLPEGNRLDDRLTVIAMTGVTAMVRGTAAKMDEFGAEWAAEVVGPVLASADITHISNEVPFVEDCKTNTDPNNLTFCSHPDYMAALEKTGVDIIGLTGNHQNDYGYDDAIYSLELYEEVGLPVYGGGEDRESARKPLLLEHNGNKLAFLGANSFGPRFAWSTEYYPGSAEFDLNIMSAMIRDLKERDMAEVVLTELQYQERYDVVPLAQQRDDFNALVRTGSDIVTGVQSHVPQAVEFTDGNLILYGLGNLFFDQMWEEETREGIIAKHTIYDNRHISTQLLTTMLHDSGQPQWTTPEENERILNRVFDASYWEY